MCKPPENGFPKDVVDVVKLNVDGLSPALQTDSQQGREEEVKRDPSMTVRET